jgi:hypothetical protein
MTRRASSDGRLASLDEAVYDAGIVECGVQSPEPRQGQSYEVLGKSFVRDIAGQCRTLSINVGGKGRQAVGVDIGQHQPCTFFGKALGCPTTEAARSSGNQYGHSVRSFHAASMVLPARCASRRTASR